MKQELFKQYKGFTHDRTCRGMRFVRGKTYTVKGPAVLCHNGFHTCNTLQEVFSYYPPSHSDYAEVAASCEARGDDKNCSLTLRVVRWLSFPEVMRLTNRKEDGSEFAPGENRNWGFGNTGNNNLGNGNTGNSNSGNYNHGNDNSGNCNHGNNNHGNYNRGNYNHGNDNTGNYNNK